MLFAHTNSGVRNRQPNRQRIVDLLKDAQPKLHPAGLREFQSVTDQVDQDLAQPLFIPYDQPLGRRVGEEAQFHRGLLRQRRMKRDQITDQPPQIQRRRRQLNLTGLHARKIEDVIDHPEQPQARILEEP